MVVVDIDPLGCFLPVLIDAFKDVRIELCLAICTTKASGKSVLNRLTWFDELQIDLVRHGLVGDGNFRAL